MNLVSPSLWVASIQQALKLFPSVAFPESLLEQCCAVSAAVEPGQFESSVGSDHLTGNCPLAYIVYVSVCTITRQGSE